MTAMKAYTVVSLILALSGCYASSQEPDQPADPGGVGGSISNDGGSAGEGGSGGSHDPECALPSDCPGEANECASRTCKDGVCGWDYAPDGTPLAEQVPGDCQTWRCHAGFITLDTDDFDTEDTTEDCTTIDHCTGTEPIMTTRPERYACTAPAGRMCDSNANCVECLIAADCGDPTEVTCTDQGKCLCIDSPAYGTDMFDQYCQPGWHAVWCGSAVNGPMACKNLTANGMWCCP